MKRILLCLILIFNCVYVYSGPNGAAFVAPNPLDGMPKGISPEAQAYNQWYQAQMAQATVQAVAQKKAALAAAAMAEKSEAVLKITQPRDAALARLNQEETNKILEMESLLKQLKDAETKLLDEKLWVDAQDAHAEALQFYEPTDPWRVLNGRVCYAKGQNWVEFVGEVIEVKNSGIFVHGHFGPPLDANSGERDFFVENFPHTIADGETITSIMRMNASFSGETCVFTNNNTINGGVHTVRELDYGKICEAPSADIVKKLKSFSIHFSGNHPEIEKKLSDNKIQQSNIGTRISLIQQDFESKRANIMYEGDKKLALVEKEIADKHKAEANEKEKAKREKIVKYYQDLADKGDAAGMLRMGEIYRDGYGVEKDLAKAKIYLQKAADAGSPTAVDELKSCRLTK